MESQFKKSDNNVLVLVILGAIVFFVFIMPMLDKANASEEAKLKEHLNNIEPTVKIDKNMCSRQCCKFSQWPVPHDLKIMLVQICHVILAVVVAVYVLAKMTLIT